MNWKTLWKAKLLTPAGLSIRAAIIIVCFLAVHLAGWRDHTSIVAGTVGSMETSWRASVIFGVSYLALYMGAVVVAPILFLAAGMLFIWNKVRGNPPEGVSEYPGARLCEPQQPRWSNR